MATIQVQETVELVPSGYTGLSNLTTASSYPITNGYTDSSSTTYARFTLSSGSTGSIYFTFDTSAIPADATIDSIACSVRARVSSTSRVTSTQAQLYSGTTAKGSNSTFASTSTTNTFSLTCGTWTRAELDDLRLKIGGTGSSGSGGGSSRYIYFYGADVTITYTYEATAYTVTATLTGDGTISPSGATTKQSGEEYVLTITPDDTSETVTATQDGTDITSQLVGHGAGATVDCNLGTYTLESGGFSSSGATYFAGIVGNGVDATQTTSNYYSSGSSTQAVFTYSMAFNNIPSNATIERVYCEVNGHAESTSNSNEYMCVQLKSGSTDLSEQINFKDIGTSNTTITLECETLPTVAQLASMVLECTVGYYGGAINGATCYVVYSVPAENPEYYTYTFTVTADTVIAVTIGGSGSQPELYLKVNGAWVQVDTAYKKVNGAWVEQDVSTVFQSGINYRKGTT